MGTLPSLPTRQFGSRSGGAASSIRRALPTAPLQGPHMSKKPTTTTKTTTTKSASTSGIVNEAKQKEAPTTPAELSRRSKSRRPTAEASNSGNPFDTRALRTDRLGTLVSDLADALNVASSWEEFVGSFRGPSYLSPLVDELDHPAASLLSKWRDEGVPVQTTVESWTAEQKDEGIARGCHHSANKHADLKWLTTLRTSSGWCCPTSRCETHPN